MRDPPAKEESSHARDACAARLSRAVHRQDRAGVQEFYELWFDACYGMARSFTRRDESFCLDVVQETMLRVVRFIKPMSSHAGLERWLLRVTQSAALDMLKAERRRSRREADAHSPIGPVDPAEQAERDELIAWLSAQLSVASAGDQALLMRRFGQDCSIAESGESTPGAAHGRLRRILARLRLLAPRDSA